MSTTFANRGSQPSPQSRLLLFVRERLAVLDPPLLVLIALLAMTGLMTLYSAGADFPWRFTDQLRNFAVAATVMFLFASIPPTVLMKFALPAYAVGVVLLIGVELVGVTVKGAQRWLNLGIVTIQPSEIMRLALPLMLAWYFQKREGQIRSVDFLVAATLVAIPVVLILHQPDLGTALLVLAAGAFVIFFAGLPWKWIASLAIAGIAFLPVAWTLMHDYQRQRVLTLIDPSTDRLGRRIRQGLDAGHADPPGVHSRAHQRLHLRRLLRGVRSGRQCGFAGAFLCTDHPGTHDLIRRRYPVRTTAGRGDCPHHLHVLLCQHGHGERHPARGGRAPAVHELRRHCAGHPGHGLRHVDEHPAAPQTGADLRGLE
jgi:hypothetical protein